MVILLLRRNLRIKKELVKEKESSTELYISAPASSISDTIENISYRHMSRNKTCNQIEYTWAMPLGYMIIASIITDMYIIQHTVNTRYHLVPA